MGFKRGDQGQSSDKIVPIAFRSRCSAGGRHDGPCPSTASYLHIARYPSGATRQRPLCVPHALRCAEKRGITFVCDPKHTKAPSEEAF